MISWIQYHDFSHLPVENPNLCELMEEMQGLLDEWDQIAEVDADAWDQCCYE